MTARPFKAGAIAEHLSEWKKYTSDRGLLQVVSGCPVEFYTSPPKNTRSKAYPVSPVLSSKMNDEIQSMVSKGILKQVEFSEDLFLSPIFARVKKSGALRIILDLKMLNEYVPYKHFKMEGFENALSLVRPGTWFTSLDLKDAYYSVLIKPEDQKYFAFEFMSKYYVYRAMPNGWANAPYIFTKLLKPVFYQLRSKGHISSYFLDDSLLLAQICKACKENYNITK